MFKHFFTAKRLCRAGVIAALYVALTYAFAPVAFGAFFDPYDCYFSRRLYDDRTFPHCSFCAKNGTTSSAFILSDVEFCISLTV